ncbi:MAG: GspE/PulE family protein [bacterium]|nr:GspE/PulE family protein [bacterium]
MDDLSSFNQTMRRQDEETNAQMLAAQYSVPYINLIGYPIAPDILSIIPQELAVKYNSIAFMRAQNKVHVAILTPENPEMIKFLQELAVKTKYEFAFVLCSPASINHALELYKTLKPDQSSHSSDQIDTSQTSADDILKDVKNLTDLKDKIKTISTTQLLDVIFGGAVKIDAADIHLEPAENGVRIRYRIDGVLQEVAILPLDVYKSLNSRIKFLSNLKLDVKTTPQDGRFSIKTGPTDTIDIRISTMPAAYGEIIDMRLLNSKDEIVDLANLGIRPDALALIEEAVAKPNGLVLNTGPTGSGKTTTLYAILNKLNKPGIKIITLEDPIEYKIPNIDQVQINAEKGYTFAAALRASLRQDPNIIMVGEMRDKETAEIGLQAAMTGHLVLSTLHTNNAPASLGRLMDMGIEPYLLAGSINLIIAQRLVRKVCVSCKGKGCSICNHTGFKGRIAIIECLKPNDVINNLIIRKAPLSEFLKVAKQEGMKTMEEDGMEKVAQGITTKEEILRVTQE